MSDIKLEDPINTNAWERVQIARKADRLRSLDIIHTIIDSFIELHGDRNMGDDPSIIGGIGFLNDIPVTVIGQHKGNSAEEMKTCNYGMTLPEGYRKALRLMKQAQKFGRPIICLIDTPGAFPGVTAEQHGQAEAIAKNIYEMSQLQVPVISVIIGEGGSGGALALAVANQVFMLENAVYSVVSPEGGASILYKDSKRAPDMTAHLKMTAQDLKHYEIVEGILSEAGSKEEICQRIKVALYEGIVSMLQLTSIQIRQQRYCKFRKVGSEITSG